MRLNVDISPEVRAMLGELTTLFRSERIESEGKRATERLQVMARLRDLEYLLSQPDGQDARSEYDALSAKLRALSAKSHERANGGLGSLTVLVDRLLWTALVKNCSKGGTLDVGRARAFLCDDVVKK